jgi:hypothetical protein
MTVLTCDEIKREQLTDILHPFGLGVEWVQRDGSIPGSYWGEPEAGLVGRRLVLRGDTPVHSALHEAGHFICMDEARRASLHTDAGGDCQEENGVCYLQVLLSELLEGVGMLRLLRDMDTWGYSFRLGSARRWFEEDAEDARGWLMGHGILAPDGALTWRPRR